LYDGIRKVWGEISMVGSPKALVAITTSMYFIAGVVIFVMGASGLYVRESLNLIVYGSAVAAIGVAHVPVLLHPFGRRAYLGVLTALAAMLGVASSIIFTSPFTMTGVAVAPGAVMDVVTFLNTRTARKPSSKTRKS
jgi:hypothetical protein